MSDNTEALQTAFEQIIAGPPYERDVRRFADDGRSAWPGNYRDIAVDLAWCVLRDCADALAQQAAPPAAQAEPAPRNPTMDADVAGVAAALEQQRALKIVEAVAELGDKFSGKAFASGYSQACEEIAERLRTEQWVIGDTKTPLPATQAGDALPPTIDALMEQAQVFASSWSLVGGRFDSGDGLPHAEAMKAELRKMIEAALAARGAQAGLLLRELLAVIHRDGGHYADEHGLQKATEDAVRRYYELAAAENAERRLSWLHSTDAQCVDGYEWGIFRVKWQDGRAVDVQQTLADFSDLDAARAALKGQPEGQA